YHPHGNKQMYSSSANIRTRNMIKRVQILIPINDRKILAELKAINRLYHMDNIKSRTQKSDGKYEYVKNEYEPISAQDELMRRAENYGLEQQVQKENELLLKVKQRFKKRK